jgi:hypothetical protein
MKIAEIKIAEVKIANTSGIIPPPRADLARNRLITLSFRTVA